MSIPATYADNIVETVINIKLKSEIRRLCRFADINRSNKNAEAAKQIINSGPPKSMAITEPNMPTNELAPKRPTAHVTISIGKKAAKS